MAISTFKATVSMTDEPGKYIAQSREFNVTFDTQKRNNGYDFGITPNEGILCSLGACEDIVAGSFYKRQKFAYQSFYIVVDGQIRSNRPGYDQINLDLHFKTSKTKEETMDFVKFMEKTCPVRDNLVNRVPIITKSVEIVK